MFLLKDLFQDEVWEFSEHLSFFLWTGRQQDDEVLIYLTEIQKGCVLGGQLIFGSDLHLLWNDSTQFETVCLQLLQQKFQNSNPCLIGHFSLQDQESRFEKMLSQSFSANHCFLTSSENFTKWSKKNFTKSDRDAFKKLLSLNEANLKEHQHQRSQQKEKWKMLQEDFQKNFQDHLFFYQIEGYDISTFQGKQTVGSQVVFKDGCPSPNDYRRYLIRSSEAQTNDFDSLVEVLTRRFSKKTPAPDIILIDGGKPQIQAILKHLEHCLPQNTKLIGIAKKRQKNHLSYPERMVFFSSERSRYETVALEEGSALYQLLTQVRNEAHRFANQYHRLKRDQSSLQSVFLSFSKEEKKKILDICQPLHKIRDFNSEELARRTHISLKKIQHLQAIYQTEEQ
jgi:excinuclease UvrABC nuclease subunit